MAETQGCFFFFFFTSYNGKSVSTEVCGSEVAPLSPRRLRSRFGDDPTTALTFTYTERFGISFNTRIPVTEFLLRVDFFF